MAREITSGNSGSTRTLRTESVANSTTANNDNYLERLVKLIPSEIIAAYTFIIGILKGVNLKNPESIHPLVWIVIGTLTLFTPLYLSKLMSVKKPLQLIYTTVAFIIWALNIYSPISISGEISFSIYISVVLILYTLLIPFIYKGQN
jgi:hypothetical protein